MCRGIIHRLDWVVKKVKKDGQFIERLKPGGEPVFTDNIIKALRFSEATAKIYRDCGGGFEMEKLNAPDETTPDLTT